MSGQDLCGENYIERAFRFLARQNTDSFPSLSVEVHSEIPMRAGLGSSAAATVAGLRLYEALAGPLPMQAIINAACALESHPDNAAAAVLGGLTSSCQLPGWFGLRDDLSMAGVAGALCVATPDIPLSTAESRTVLPSFIPRSDVVFNLQRMSLLLQLLQSGDFSLLKQALGDRLHQPFRQKIVPGLEQALHLDALVIGSVAYSQCTGRFDDHHRSRVDLFGVRYVEILSTITVRQTNVPGDLNVPVKVSSRITLGRKAGTPGTPALVDSGHGLHVAGTRWCPARHRCHHSTLVLQCRYGPHCR